jgi:hypothetical protein
MVNIVSYKALRGLDLNSNPYIPAPGKDSGTTRNAAQIADNCVITRQRMIGNRQGFDYFINPTSALVDKLFEYQNQIIMHQTDNTLWYGDNSSGTRTQIAGTFVNPSGVTMDATVARGSLFLTSSQGPIKLDAIGNAGIRAGITKGLDVRLSLAGAGSAMPNNTKAAYHVTWSRVDANNQTVRSDVSTAQIITNSAGSTQNVTVQFTVPWDVRTGDKYEVWRTVTTASSNTSPGDDCYLVQAVTNSAAAGATVSFTDSTSDTTLQASTPLYTNATQSGALAGNARPPLAGAIATYKDYLILGNTSLDQQLNMALLGLDNWISGATTITLTNSYVTRTYRASTTENVLTQNFQMYTGLGSASLNIAATVQSLMHVINGDPSGMCYGEYTSGINDIPGLFRLWARDMTTGTFWLTADSTATGNEFSPVVPTSGFTVISSNDARPNRLFYSQFQQPDAVPIVNYLDIGQLSQPILKILSVRDACFIIKSDGVWYLSGQVAPFNLNELDQTCHCVARDTAVTLNNNVYMLSQQGVVKVNNSGVTVISFDIEPAIMNAALPLSNLSTVAFGIGSEATRQYILYLPTGAGDTYATQAYVFHTFVEEWCRSLKPAAAGIALNSNYTLYLSSGQETALLKQRNNGDNTDYSDETLPITIVSQSSDLSTLTITWSSSPTFSVTTGMSVHQSVSFAKVLAAAQVSGNTYTLTIDRSVTYSAGAATVRMPISSHLRLSPNNAGESGMIKTMYAAGFMLTSPVTSALQQIQGSVTQATIEVATNEAPQLSSYPITRAVSIGWGQSAWGTTPFGDQINPTANVPWLVDMPIPDHTGESVTVGWYHSVSQEQYFVSQVAIEYDVFDEYEVTQ